MGQHLQLCHTCPVSTICYLLLAFFFTCDIKDKEPLMVILSVLSDILTVVMIKTILFKETIQLMFTVSVFSSKLPCLQFKPNYCFYFSLRVDMETLKYSINVGASLAWWMLVGTNIHCGVKHGHYDEE